MKLTDRRRLRDSKYPIRLGLAVVICQILFILLFRFWPDYSEEPELVYRDSFVMDEILLDDITITRQGRETPPPPVPPRIDNPEPVDDIVEVELDFEELFDPEVLPDEGLPDPEGDSDEVVAYPSQPANVSRIVEPVIPSEFRRQNIRAQIVVTFVIGRDGVVEDVSINELRLYDRSEQEFKTVEHIGFGIEDATIEAAMRWRFRPAYDDDRLVRSLARHTFTFGS